MASADIDAAAPASHLSMNGSTTYDEGTQTMTEPRISGGLGWRRLAVAGLLLALGVCGLPRSGLASESAPGAAGLARLWVYRDYQPYDSVATPYVRANGVIIGVSRPGAAFYRDLPPGRYAVTVDSDGSDQNQFASVPLAPGQAAFVKVLSLNSWASGGGGNLGSGWTRDTFYTWWMPPEAAAAAIAQLPLYGG